MKIAAFGDLHAHSFKEFDRKSDRTGSQRLDNIVDTLLFIRDDSVRRGVELVAFVGDMFHVRGKVDTIVFNAIYDTLKTFHQHGLEVVAIAGNHDQKDNSDVPEHSLHAFNDIPGVTVYGDLALHYVADEDLFLHCVPYSKNAQRIKDWVSDRAKEYGGEDVHWTNRDTQHICLFHLGISGAFVGNGSYPMADAFVPEDLRPDFYKYVVGGHFHRRQLIDGYDNFLYTGAPIQHSFGDEGEEKGYVILDTERRCDIQFIPVPNPMFYSMTLDQMTHEILDEHVVQGNYVRALLKENEVQTFNSIVPQGLNYKLVLEKTYEEQTRIDVRIGMTEEEVVTKYAQEHNPDALDIGLRILEEVKGNVQ